MRNGNNMSDKSKSQQLKEDLFYTKRNVYEARSKEEIDKAFEYSKGYMKYIDASKTEREAVIVSVKMLEDKGFVPYTMGMPLKPGDKLYYNNRGKSLFAFTIGTEDIENGIRISAAHIDSPRIDLKQHPLYEDSGFAFLKTHYYGGIRKYQWITIPLALHGVVIKADGTAVDIVIGEDENDPVMVITDLLPHLAKTQSTQTLSTAFSGEALNILIGSSPYRDEDGKLAEADADKFKLNIMAILNEKYGIKESDFMSAELMIVPAAKAKDVGLDRALIGAYGHDDRVCAYPALTALIENATSKHTLMCILADKEEVGSNGNSGMHSRLLVDLINEISAALGKNENIVRANTKCLSADVSAGFDPNYADVYEKRNSALMSGGVVLTKYTGSGGKGGTSDASAEFVAFMRNIFDENDIIWQTAELGKVDQGGGGTVAMYIANENIEVVDLGVPVLSMHAPYELISKVDLYETHRAFSAFCS